MLDVTAKTPIRRADGQRGPEGKVEQAEPTEQARWRERLTPADLDHIHRLARLAKQGDLIPTRLKVAFGLHRQEVQDLRAAATSFVQQSFRLATESPDASWAELKRTSDQLDAVAERIFEVFRERAQDSRNLTGEPGDPVWALAQLNKILGALAAFKPVEVHHPTTTPPLDRIDPAVGTSQVQVGADARVTVAQQISARFLKMTVVTEGLQTAYSPNHTLTTAAHLLRQGDMVVALARADYEQIAAFVKNPNEAMRASAEEIREVLAPLVAGLTPDDYRILAIVAGIHDLGKIDVKWARANSLKLAGTDFIAHDFETKELLRSNPGLLSGFGLSAEETRLVEELSKWHSFPGQFVFGEGNLAAYDGLASGAFGPPETVLKIARAQGVLDVLSALNERFVRPILNSHVALRGAVDDMVRTGCSGQEKFEEITRRSVGPDVLQVGRSFGLGPVSTYRLTKLTGLPNDDKAAATLKAALAHLDPSFLQAFNRHTFGSDTWYGTYVLNAFGASLFNKLKDELGVDQQQLRESVIEAMVKVVAASGEYRARLAKYEEDGPFALSAHLPSLRVAKGGGEARAVLDATSALRSIDQALQLLTSGESPLTLRGNHYAIEVGWRGDGVDAIGGIAQSLADQDLDLRFYHVLNHLTACGFDTEKRAATGMIPERVIRAFAQTQADPALEGGVEIGKGSKGRIVRTPGGRIFKIAHSPEYVGHLAVEAAVAKDLTRKLATYGVDVSPVIGVGPEGAYLEKQPLESGSIGDELMARQKGQLTRLQLWALERTFVGAKRYAQDTGISLDLTSDNLAWDQRGSRWLVIDPGPRTSASRRKYKYTIDCPDFESYRRRWNRDTAR